MYQIYRQDILEWVREYQGEKFHALLTDAPYHLTSITKRFGKDGSAPAKGDVYRRASAGFMSQTWDGGGISFDPETWAALAEHLYPGAFGMTFASPRTHHRIACAIEDAGMIIQPTFYCWVYLSGFPKATQISSQIDKLQRREYVQAAIELGLTIPGNNLHDWTKAEHTPGDKWWEKFKSVLSDDQWQAIERKVIGKSQWSHQMGIPLPNTYNGERQHLDITAPATPLARDWAGHRYGGQAIKPAVEPVIIFQKPYEGRPVENIVRTGAGALNIDGGRIAAPEGITTGGAPNGHNNPCFMSKDIDPRIERTPEHPAGRWPANFILSHHPDDNGECHPDCPVRLFDEQAGESGPSGWTKSGDTALGQKSGWNSHNNREVPAPQYDDSGPASRMFHRSDWAYEVAEQLANAEPVRYEPKVSSSEREAGLDELETRTRHRVNAGGLENEPRFAPTQVKNNHPCLKPISLTKYLCTLLSPPAAYAPRRILIPFAGSGSEIIGAILSGGFEEIIGIEAEANYVKIAEARCSWWSQWPGWGQTDVDAILAADNPRKKPGAGDKEDDRQLTMFGTA